MRLRASGTNGVPLAIELCFREGGQLDGCRPIPDAPRTFLLQQGFRGIGWRGMRFSLGRVVRRIGTCGYEARLPGLSVYVTAFAPFGPGD